MPSLEYRGIVPASDTSSSRGLLIMDTTNAASLVAALPITQTTVLSQVRSYADNYANLGYLGNALQGYDRNNTLVQQNAAARYQETIDKLALNIKTDQLAGTDSATITGQLSRNPYVVASTDSTGRVPVIQCPSMGTGFVVGPIAPTSVGNFGSSNQGGDVTISSQVIKIAEWFVSSGSVQSQSGKFQPLVYMVVKARSLDSYNLLSRPVIEVRASTTPYSAGGYTTFGNTLVAMGMGRSAFFTTQAIAVMPCSSSFGLDGNSGGTSPFAINSNFYLTAWIYDVAGNLGAKSYAVGVSSAAAFLMSTT